MVVDDSGNRASRPFQIRFDPDGTATGARIALTEGPRKALVTVDWLTGSTRLEVGP